MQAATWHEHGRWRPEVDPNDEAAAAGGEASAGAGAGASAWRARSPHFLYREANAQLWAGGVFPGRVGTSSQKHDCLPPWDVEALQQALLPQRTRPTRRVAPRQHGALETTLEALLGPRAFDAYNEHTCEQVGGARPGRRGQRRAVAGSALSGSPVSLLRTWLPAALLGSRESAVAGDCTHSWLYGSTNAFYNQLMMHTVWRREARGRERRGGHVPVSAPPPRNRLDTWRELQQMLRNANENVPERDRSLDGSYGGVCYGVNTRSSNSTYRPHPRVCSEAACTPTRCPDPIGQWRK